MADWNATTTALPSGTLPELFEEQARKLPDQIAVTCGAEQMSYCELDIEVNRLARHLVNRGIGPERIVAISLSRSVALVVATLAVLKAGAAYLPVDAHLPAERVKFMMADAHATMLLTDTTMMPKFAGLVDSLVLDDEAVRRQISQDPAAQLLDRDRIAPLRPDNIAYVIYTSGSSGRPKGVAVSHAGNVNFLQWMRVEYGICAGDRLRQSHLALPDRCLSYSAR